jgi:hypothetical protein
MASYYFVRGADANLLQLSQLVLGVCSFFVFAEPLAFLFIFSVAYCLI